MNFDEVIRTRRSVRKFTDKPVTEEILTRVLDIARIAPSGSNRQPWANIIIRDKERMKVMAQLCCGQKFVAEAPVLIVICGKNINYDRGGYMGDMSMLVDVSISIDHLILAARAEGLGTCLIGAFDNQGLKKALELPTDMDVVALTPLGYPADPNAFNNETKRKTLAQITFNEKMGIK